MPCSISPQYLNQFVESVRDFYRQDNKSQLGILNEMSDFLDQIVNDSSKNYSNLENKVLLPAIHHLPAAIHDASGVTKKIAETINQLAPFLN